MDVSFFYKNEILFRSGRPTLPSYLPYPPQSQMQSHVPHVSHHNMSYNRDRSSRLSGLVSNKTISDFALSPFAGFVSKKERSWLIKIQQLQCQGCGNPYEDDFYYTVCFMLYLNYFFISVRLERSHSGFISYSHLIRNVINMLSL